MLVGLIDGALDAFLVSSLEVCKLDRVLPSQRDRCVIDGLLDGIASLLLKPNRTKGIRLDAAVLELLLEHFDLLPEGFDLRVLRRR